MRRTRYLARSKEPDRPAFGREVVPDEHLPRTGTARLGDVEERARPNESTNTQPS
ncbi:hypothetical protein [Streptomyces sp. NPDC002580]|uniref:hypothetical protein n=1 Tax=Streptomyces sp. NPDC002580 TaxID=3364653 RepID=UPI0036B2E5A7